MRTKHTPEYPGENREDLIDGNQSCEVALTNTMDKIPSHPRTWNLLVSFEGFNRVLLSGRSLVFSYPTVHTQQSTVPPGVAEHNVTVARAFTKLMGAFVTFWDNDAGSKIHLLANPGQNVASIGAASLESQMQLGSLQYPHNYEGSLGALPLPLGPCGDLRRHGAQHHIDRAGYLRHSFIAGFPTERVPKMPLWRQHSFGRPGSVHFQGARRHDDGCVHPPDRAVLHARNDHT